MKDPLLIILYFYCLFFVLHLIVNWINSEKNYTMLVFCVIMLLFLIFQNVRNFILLLYMA